MEEKRGFVLIKKLESYLSMKRRNKGNKKPEPRPRPEFAPSGCFPVYVGPEKQRFVIKAEYANHPLFKMLLEDAEMEYGFTSEGPLLLPCDVVLFCKILAEMECDDGGFDERDTCGFGFGYGTCSPFNPARRLGKSGSMAKGCTSYGILNTPTLLDTIN